MLTIFVHENGDTRQATELDPAWLEPGRRVKLWVDLQNPTEEGRAVRPDLKLGVCGEHGGDPESVHFFHEVGLDYVSCSPFRVPVARLEAGRAALTAGESDSR